MLFHQEEHHPLFTRDTWFFLGIVTVLAFFTYFFNYQYPAAFFWDENYYLTSAQKYLNGIFFMATHPPLGELFMALGEKLLNANPVDTQFIDQDYANGLPDGFSFAGFRFFPVLFGWIAAPVIFCIFLLITRRPLWALLLSFFYLFENAYIVHVRGAMLEGFLLFFASSTILAFLALLEKNLSDRARTVWSLVFGLAFGFLLTVKVVGLIFIFLLPVLGWWFWPDVRKILQSAVLIALGFFVAYVWVWQAHFTLGKTINPKLHTEGYYFASEEYKQILTEGKTGSLQHFLTMYRDNERYAENYHHGVTRLDLCKTEENGSPWFFWPFGGRSINYRWETPNSTHYRYLYLQVNPAVWWTGTLSVFVALAMVFVSFFFPVKEGFRHRIRLLVFLGLYAAYIAGISRIDRVMYLYHYFLPMLLSLFLFAVCFMEVQAFGRWKLTEGRKTWILFAWAAFVFFSFQFYRPLSYYEPLTKKQFERRAIFPLWELTCVNCERKSMLVEAK